MDPFGLAMATLLAGADLLRFKCLQNIHDKNFPKTLSLALKTFVSKLKLVKVKNSFKLSEVGLQSGLPLLNVNFLPRY